NRDLELNLAAIRYGDSRREAHAPQADIDQVLGVVGNDITQGKLEGDIRRMPRMPPPRNCIN
ncbi:unnamed protein product, partial [marine sediment metagenome]